MEPNQTLEVSGLVQSVNEGILNDPYVVIVPNMNTAFSGIQCHFDQSRNWNNNKKMHKAAKVKKELVVIKGATHTFWEEGRQEELYAATVRWFKKFQ
ncbi:MAG TPA: hypothetical protein VMA75_03505 [Candidatus Paceibacterota bacterium]|nr:hypothetical protein [Candidatus Paceibacterota bacterium]